MIRSQRERNSRPLDLKKTKHTIMKNLLLIALTLVLFASCEDAAPEPIQPIVLAPNMPASIAFDADGDSKDDFVISYKEYASDDVPSSAGSIVGSIEPVGKNQLLYHSDGGYLFLNNNDTIEQSPNKPLRWSGSGADLIKIDRANDQWNRQWSVLSSKGNQFVVAYKTTDHRMPFIGYLVLDLDKHTGEIIIVGNQITSTSAMKVKLEN